MRGSHLRLVAEQAESEAAAFELHLQGGAPRHGDPAPVVSSEHAGGWARLPTLCTPPAPGSALSPRLQSREPARQSAGRAGKLTLRSSQTPPPETTPGLGRARRTPCPPPPKARPAGPVLGRQAVSPTAKAPNTSRALRECTIPSGPRPLTWARGGAREAPPHQPPPPGTPDSLSAENPLATWIAAWHTSALAWPRYGAQSHA